MNAKNTKKARGSRRTKHDGPSKASLREIPEVAADAITFGRGLKALSAAAEHIRAVRKQGRPKKGEASRATTVRALRLPDDLWEEVLATAKKQKVSAQVLLRKALYKYLAELAA